MNTLMLTAAILLAAEPAAKPTIVLVVGAGGSEAYAKMFDTWAARWEAAADLGGAELVRIGSDESAETSDRDRLRSTLADPPADGSAPLWLVLIGHGTFDGREAKFNLRGPDVTAAELAEWLNSNSRPLAVINCASSSGPFINQLSAPQRVVVTATKSGHEHNLARFGDYLSAAIADDANDLDKDQQTSLLEAFLAASKQTAEFYQREGRLATEHALIDDNGDGRGTPADWFRGFRAVRRASDGASPDGLRANQFHLVGKGLERDMPASVRMRRDRLEASIAALRARKAELAEDAYYTQLEPLLFALARLYESLSKQPR